MFIQRVKHYHQWLRSAIPLKTKLGQISSDNIRIQGPSKRPSLSQLHPVSAVKERYQKGRKCKISRVLQSPVSSTQASPKVEASNRPKQAQHFSTRREVQDGNSRVHQDLPDCRGMGIVDRSIGCLPSHPHPSSLREIPKILPQVSGVPVHLPTFRTTAPQVFTMIVKEVKPMALSKGLRLHQYLDDWLIRSQSREEALVNTQAVVDLTQSLGWIINQQKSELNLTQVFSFVGYEYHLDSALVKPTQERWLKLQDFILQLKSKHVLTARCLMSLIGLLASTEKMVPEGQLHMRPFQFHLKEHWKFPQPLDSLLPWTEAISAHLDWWQNPANVMKGSDLHPKDHSIQLFTDTSNEGWGAHLEQSSTQGLWSPQEKGLHINVLELKAVFLALRHFKDQCQDQTVLVATDNSNVVAYINKQGGTHSAEMCALLWRIMTWCHHSHITLKARHIPGCLNVMGDLLSRSNQVQSTEWSLHPQVFKQISQKWFTPHMDLFATHLNHKLPLYVSPIPDPKAWDIDALNIDWTGLTAYAYPPTALLHRVIQKIRQCNCLIILIAPGWPGMPWFWDLVQLSTEIPLQLPVSTTLLKQSHNCVFHRNLQHLNLHAWCLGVDSSKNKASLWKWQRELLHLSGHQQGPSTNQSGLYLKNGAEKIRWISPLHL